MNLKRFVFVLVALAIASTAFAQQKYTKENYEQFFKDEAAYNDLFQKLTTEKANLEKQQAELQNDINNLKEQNANMRTWEACQEELYALVGATKEDVDAFRMQVGQLEGKIRRKEGPKEERQKELDALKKNKISALPEFFNKVHVQLQRDLDAWQDAPTEKQYTVVKGDCLWNIAKKKDIYDNAFAWTKIYQSNKDQIKNPDLIYPKQVFKVPSLTEEEKAKYDKMKRNYKPAPPTK